MNITLEKNKQYDHEDILDLLKGQYKYSLIEQEATLVDIECIVSCFIVFDNFEDLIDHLDDVVDFDEEVIVCEDYEDYQKDNIIIQNVFSSRNACIYKSPNLNMSEFKLLCDSLENR